MKTYLDFLQHILTSGTYKRDRTGTGTWSVFAYQMRFDLRAGFPLVTTKQCHTKSIIHELLWFLQGNTNVGYLQENGVRIWDAWADEHGDLGPVYGKQWRDWETKDGRHIDQLASLVTALRETPESRRHIVSAWNVGELAAMALPPCHLLYQFYVVNRTLSCQVYQRSADAFLGVPFNIASYALLVHFVAAQCDLRVGELIWTGGDCHVYSNHVRQVREQLTRAPFPLPQLRLKRRPASLFEYCYDDVEILNYQCHARLQAPIAV